MAYAEKITSTLASLHHHVSPRCFFCVPTAFAAPGTRSPEASAGRRYPGITHHQLRFTAAFMTKFILGILEALAHMSIIWRYRYIS